MTAISQAFTTLGLITTFGGIGVLVNGLLACTVVQVRGGHQQNEDYRTSRSELFGS